MYFHEPKWLILINLYWRIKLLPILFQGNKNSRHDFKRFLCFGQQANPHVDARFHKLTYKTHIRSIAARPNPKPSIPRLDTLGTSTLFPNVDPRIHKQARQTLYHSSHITRPNQPCPMQTLQFTSTRERHHDNAFRMLYTFPQFDAAQRSMQDALTGTDGLTIRFDAAQAPCRRLIFMECIDFPWQ